MTETPKTFDEWYRVNYIGTPLETMRDAWNAGHAAGRLEGQREEREPIAQYMLENSYATGHGNTALDLARELEWQAQERAIRALAKDRERA